MLKYAILLLFPIISFAQNSTVHCRDSVDIWMEALSKDSLIYRPDGDSLITLVAKSENKRGILFLFDRLHERDEKYAPMVGSFQIGIKQKYYIEDILKNNCDEWVLLACSINYLSLENNIDNVKLKRILELLTPRFSNSFLKNILDREYLRVSDENKRKNILQLNKLIQRQ